MHNIAKTNVNVFVEYMSRLVLFVAADQMDLGLVITEDNVFQRR